MVLQSLKGVGYTWVTANVVWAGIDIRHGNGLEHLKEKLASITLSGALTLGAEPMISMISSTAGGMPVMLPLVTAQVADVVGELLSLAASLGIFVAPAMAWRGVKGMLWATK